MYDFNTKSLKELIVSAFEVYIEFYDEKKGDFITGLERNYIPPVGTIIELPYTDEKYIVSKIHIGYDKGDSTEDKDTIKVFVNKIG